MRRPFDRLRQEMRRCDGYPWEQQARSPLQLIPPHPSLHSQGLPSSRCLLCSPSAKESHSAEGQECTSWKGKNVRTRSQAVYASPSWRTFALPIELRALSEVATSERVELAVEAGWTTLCDQIVGFVWSPPLSQGVCIPGLAATTSNGYKGVRSYAVQA